MSRQLQGRIACVTGAASGIGRAIALRFALEGAIVVATDVSGEGSQALLHDLRQQGGAAHFIQMDVSSEPDWIRTIAEVDALFGRLDILVNNAGIGLSGPVTEMQLEDWRRQMAINVDGPFLGTKHSLPLMRKGRNGSIINMSSIAGIRAAANAAAYCASKGAVRLFSKSVALECAALNDGVRVNSLHPGIVTTAIWDSLIGTSADEHADKPRETTVAALTAMGVPLGRPGLPEEVAAAALWLASDESSYVTGSELVIDGARSIA